LTLVAGMQRSHINTLNEQGIDKVVQYVEEPRSVREKPSQGSLETFDKLHSQAKVQVIGRERENYYELKPEWFKKTDPESENKGLNQLYTPSLGDIYFDFEGDHFYPEDGLEYLFGWVVKEKGEYVYHKLWSFNHEEEKIAFQQFMDYVLKQWEAYPELHIYHFAPYEPAAISRLASRHAMYEVEVDNLLRAKVFVDIHRVIRESLQAAVEKYSLKDLEKLSGYERKLDLQDASEARRKLSAALHLDVRERITDVDKGLIEDYNRDDCLATLKLHDFLEELFSENKGLLQLTRPPLGEVEVSEKIREREERAQKLYNELKAILPEDKSTPEYQAMWLLLNSISYFRREERMAWFEYFRIRKLPADELLKEKEAIAYLTYLGPLPPANRERKPKYRYRFPPQEISGDFAKVGAGIKETEGELLGRIKGLDLEKGTIDIATDAENYNRTIHIQLSDQISQKKLEDALHHFVRQVIAERLEEATVQNSIRDLLLKNPPSLTSQKSLNQLRTEITDPTDFAIAAVTQLKNSILPIQGPPGTGKTHLGGLMILELLKNKCKVGVTAVGHKTIQNMIQKVKEHAVDQKFSIETAHYNSRDMDKPDDYDQVKSEGHALQAINEGKLVGGTAFFWAGEKESQVLDYLFIDEAGQMSLTQII
ncbi:MAG: TM0106 family RecB-like putative nuclease, partial [Opitutae bacterium]